MNFPPFLKKLKRGPQVILPKDFGAIAAFTCVGKKSVCIDAGSGSGWLACMLGNICKKVYSYEWREDFAKLAGENVARSGLKNVKIKQKSAFEGFDEKDVDLICLDMAESDKVVPHAHAALKADGFLVGFLPHAEQAQKFVSACKGAGFAEGNIFVIEVMTRDMLAREHGFRPDTMGLWHTGYLAFARK